MEARHFAGVRHGTGYSVQKNHPVGRYLVRDCSAHQDLSSAIFGLRPDRDPRTRTVPTGVSYLAQEMNHRGPCGLRGNENGRLTGAKSSAEIILVYLEYHPRVFGRECAFVDPE